MKIFCAVVVCVLCAAGFAGTVNSINGSDLQSGFDPVGGDFGLGVFTVADTGSVVLQFADESQQSISNCAFSFATFLFADLSAGGYATGEFKGGVFSILNACGDALLGGSIEHITIREAIDGGGMLAGNGSFTIAEGLHAGDFPGAIGDLVNITFGVQPSSISNFSQTFTGRTNLSMMPVPEPASICLLVLGAAAIRKKK